MNNRLLKQLGRGSGRWVRKVDHLNPTPNSKSHLGFSDQVTSKIRNVESLLTEIGSAPRSRTVVMCHGTFDLVHPGHLRHLAYARSRGDVLVVSLTADVHVTKANLRPYVPEHLRALNLAALELVDFVIIDRNAEPLELIQQLKPDLFVKGFEYGDDLHPKTADEKKAIESIGGRMIFSPGDFVLSSSAVIENDPPNIRLEKLLTLMQVEGLSFADVRNCAMNLGDLSIAVVGDVIVDGLTTATVIGGYRKTPTPSLKVESVQEFVGGAGIVAKHIAAAGASVRLISIVGDDDKGRMACDDLLSAGVICDIHTVKERPTTYKNAVLADGYRLVRIDNVENESIGRDILRTMTQSLSTSQVDAVVYSDFRHGIFNKSTIPALIAAAPTGALTVADSQVASRWGNILDFAGCDILTPNEQEVRFAMGDQDTVLRPLGSALYDQARCNTLMLKLGPRGLLTFRSSFAADERHSFFAMDSLARPTIVDPVGSGDAMLAYATLAHASTGNAVLASILGSIAAGIECEFDGNVPVSPELVVGRIDELEKAAGHK